MNVVPSSRRRGVTSSSAAAAVITAAADPYRGTVRRRETTIQIRKQNKDTVLRRKRGISGDAASVHHLPTAAASSSDNNNNKENQIQQLELCISNYFHHHPSIPKNLWSLRDALVSSSRESIALAFERLLAVNEDGARTLIKSLLETVVKGNGSDEDDSAFVVLLELTSALTSSEDTGDNDCSNDIDTTTTTSPKNENYYGNAPIQWSDLLLTTTTTTTTTGSSSNSNNNLLSILISILQTPSATKQQSRIEMICNILGNLVQDSSMALTTLLPHWSILVSCLPMSCYCCATILRHDYVHYGMDFLSVLSVQQITNLLVSSSSTISIQIEALWILEGLSRREDEAVHTLCRGQIASSSSSSTLLSQLVHVIHDASNALVHAANATQAKKSQEILVPALRTTRNMMFVGDGCYVRTFVNHELFVPSLNQLLEPNFVMTDAIYVASACLIGTWQHSNNNNEIDLALCKTAMSNFLPRLTSILLSEGVRLEWKRQAVIAIAELLVDDSDGRSPLSEQRQRNMRNDKDGMIQDLLWNNNSRHVRDKTMSVLIDLCKGYDTDAIVAALQILNYLLRHIEWSRTAFIMYDGVDILEQICANTNDVEMASQLASRLIDDLFDIDDDEVDDYYHNNVDSNDYYNVDDDVVEPDRATTSHQFAFSSTLHHQKPFDFASSSTTTTNSSFSQQQQQLHINVASSSQATPPMGRGRGRTVPAWMQQQQERL